MISLASTFAGIGELGDVFFPGFTSFRVLTRDFFAIAFSGFGNAGVHLPHGISYPISGLNKKKGQYKHKGYEVDHPIVPVSLLLLALSSSLERCH